MFSGNVAGGSWRPFNALQFLQATIPAIVPAGIQQRPAAVAGLEPAALILQEAGVVHEAR
jgi:hypothetical protein